LNAAGLGNRASREPHGAKRTYVRWVPFLVLVAGVLLLGSEVREGWVPHDEGALGQSAERVLAGQVPHRDFNEIYTGLLSYLHAGVFAFLPVSSLSMRLPLVLVALVWLWTTYRILLRFLAPGWAGATAVTALVWGVPNYPAPLPSWYILFVATFSTLALVRWVEDRRSVWLGLAGFWGGLAFLFKLSGVFVILGGGLALLALSPSACPATAPPRRTAFGWAVALVATGSAVILTMVVTTGGREFVRLALPTSLLLVALAIRSLRPCADAGLGQWGETAARLGPFAAGVAVPVAAYAGYQASLGALPMLLEGVFVTPMLRVEFAYVRPPRLVFLLLAIPMGAFLWLPLRGSRASLTSVSFAAVWFTGVLVLSRTEMVFYQFGWMSAWLLLLFVAVDGARLILAREHGGESHGRESAMVLACVAVATALVEYPFSTPIYVLYAFPLTLVAAVALVRLFGRSSGALQATILCFLMAFGLFRNLPPRPLATLGKRYEAPEPPELLDLPRAGLLVPAHEARGYRELVTLVRDRAAGRSVWAGPEAPEVYFLSGVENQTRSFFEFLDPPEDQGRRLLARLEAVGAAVAVVNMSPQFSTRPTEAEIDSVRAVFPNNRRILKYLVLWR
jgi:hypothetical protein